MENGFFGFIVTKLKRRSIGMNIKHKLQKYACVLEQSKDLEMRIAEVRSRMTSISSTQFDVIPGGHSNSDKIADAIAKLSDLEAKYLNMIGKLAKEEIEINNLIDALELKEQQLIRLRYIDCKKWEDICYIMNYSWMHIHRLHGKILAKLEVTTKDVTECYTDNVV